MIEHTDFIGNLLACVVAPGAVVGTIVAAQWADARRSATTRPSATIPQSSGRATPRLRISSLFRSHLSARRARRASPAGP